MSGIIN